MTSQLNYWLSWSDKLTNHYDHMVSRLTSLVKRYPPQVKFNAEGNPQTAYALAASMDIDRANCNVYLVNLTPSYNSPSLHPGNAYEVGYFSGLHAHKTTDILITGYYETPCSRLYLERVLAWDHSLHLLTNNAQEIKDSNGYSIEQFGNSENLMITAAIDKTGGIISDSFEAAVTQAPILWQKKSATQPIQKHGTNAVNPQLRCYLAGPDVFKPDPIAIGHQLRSIVENEGHIGCYPMDPTIPNFAFNHDTARRIAAANEDLISSCSVMLVNMTPFRGISIDPGTAHEVGFMSAMYDLGINVLIIGYYECNPTADYHSRVLATIAPLDPENNYTVEHFGLNETLAIEGAIHKTGGTVFPTLTQAAKAIGSLWRKQ